MTKKKLLIIIVSVIVVAGAAAGAYFITKDNKDKTASDTAVQEPQSRSSESKEEETPAASTNTDPEKNKACQILTPEIAKSVLGDGAQPDATNNQDPRKQNNVTISTCTYNAGSAPQKAVSLLVRTADNAEGSAQDKELFGTGRPSNAESVSGYGESAYWNADFRELNILKGSNWYIVSSGSTYAPDRTLAETKKLAELIKSKL